MEKNLFEEQIIEVTGNNNTAYILKNHDMFYDIGFRVMKNQKSGSIMECHQLKYNGKYKFVFFTDEYTRLRDLLLSVEPDRMMVIISNLIRSIEDVESNGFLNVACIDSRLTHIFVDNRTMAVRLVYLPINIPMNGMRKAEFENEIRVQLIKLLQDLPNAESGKIKELENVLRDRSILTLSEISQRLHVSPVGQQMMYTSATPVKTVQQTPVQSVNNSGVHAAPTQNNMGQTYSGQQPTYVAPQPTPAVQQNTTPQPQLILVSETGRENIAITKSHFLIGKSADKVDGVIVGNTAVSRIHCEVVVNDLGRIAIIDKGSANGTFVNGLRIATDQNTALRVNDRVKIANEEYILVRR